MSQRRNEDEDIDGDGRPLTINERKAVRKMIENEERIQWFWGSVRVWAGWISGAVVGAWALVEIVGKVLKRTAE